MQSRLKPESRQINILDLTSPDTLYELAIEEVEFFGVQGTKLIQDLKERAADAEYTHVFHRDSIRPGIIWFVALGENVTEMPRRGKLDECRRIIQEVFPGVLARIERLESQGYEKICMAELPPLVPEHASALDLVTALEYLVFLYPQMVRAWAALVFSYSEIMGLYEAASLARHECVTLCEHAQIALYLLSDKRIEA